MRGTTPPASVTTYLVRSDSPESEKMASEEVLTAVRAVMGQAKTPSAYEKVFKVVNASV